VDGWRALIASGAGLAAAGIVGILLSAIHLLPLMEFTALSTRQLALKILDAYPLMSFLHALLFLQPPSAYMWESVISPGLAVLFLAIFAMVTRVRKAWPLVLGIVAVAELAMGNASSFYLRAVHILPDLDRLRDPVRIWFIALVPISLMAGLGADTLMRGVQNILHRIERDVLLRRVGTLVAGGLMVLFVVLSLVVTDSGYARVGDVSTITSPSLLARNAAQLAGNGRMYGAQENILQLYAVELQVPFADGFNPLLIGSYVSYMLRAGGFAYAGGYVLHFPTDSPSAQPDARLLGLMNVSVVVSSKPLTDPRLVVVEKLDGTLIYRNTAAAGPAYLVAPGSAGKPPTLNRLQRLANNVHVVTLAPEQETFTFTTTSPAYLVLAMPTFPGWVADLDNQPAAIQQIAGVLPAIKVGPGKHTLSYTYTPSSLRYGAILSAVGLLATLVWFIIACFWKPRGSWKEGRVSLKPSREVAELLVDPVTKNTSGSTDPDV